VLRFGKITGVKPEAGLFQVTFDEDRLVSGWLFGAVRNSKGNKDECPFDMDEHVACLMDENCEQGVVMFAIYDRKNPPPIGNKDIRGTTYQDGSFVQYDRVSHKLTISCEGEVEVIKSTNAGITASEKVSINAQEIEVNGGSNGGMVKVVALSTKLNEIENKINALVTAINAWLPVANDGGAALKLSLALWQSTQMNITTRQDIENPDLRH
jgi:phage baseplate assembly protein V